MVPTLTEALNCRPEGDETFLVALRYFSGAPSKGDRPLGNPLRIALGTSKPSFFLNYPYSSLPNIDMKSSMTRPFANELSVVEL
jgi:hypothetical protein